MARKPIEVGRYRYDVMGIVVPIYYDRDKNIHVAEFGDERVSKPAYQDVVAAVANLVKQRLELKWVPVIEVTVNDGDQFHRGRAAISLEFERYLIARRHGVGVDFVVCKWHLTDTGATPWVSYDGMDAPDSVKMKYSAPFYGSSELDLDALPCRPSHGGKIGDKVFLAYSEEVWEKLGAASKQIVAAKERLMDLVSGGGLALLGEAIMPKQIEANKPAKARVTRAARGA
jgi:hypothetical protein